MFHMKPEVCYWRFQSDEEDVSNEVLDAIVFNRVRIQQHVHPKYYVCAKIKKPDLKQLRHVAYAAFPMSFYKPLCKTIKSVYSEDTSIPFNANHFSQIILFDERVRDKMKRELPGFTHRPIIQLHE